jgi:hypothetical protein
VVCACIHLPGRVRKRAPRSPGPGAHREGTDSLEPPTLARTTDKRVLLPRPHGGPPRAEPPQVRLSRSREGEPPGDPHPSTGTTTKRGQGGIRADWTRTEGGRMAPVPGGCRFAPVEGAPRGPRSRSSGARAQRALNVGGSALGADALASRRRRDRESVPPEGAPLQPPTVTILFRGASTRTASRHPVDLSVTRLSRYRCVGTSAPSRFPVGVSRSGLRPGA